MNSFGRIEAVDERDNQFPMSAAIPTEVSAREWRYWNDQQWWGDQGRRPWCVAYAWLHWAEDGPVTHKIAPPPLASPRFVYERSQQIDEWPGENYSGTSVRAGAKTLREIGVISAYHWATSVPHIIEAVLERGPVVIGSRWYQNMSTPQRIGRYNFLIPTGSVLGGHAYVLNGVNVVKEFFRMKNSWGRDWSDDGRAVISFDDLQILLDTGGEACLAVEKN